MTDNNALDKKFQKELNAGIIALILLSILDKSKNPQYGYQIAKKMETASAGTISKLGTLYPVLRSLESGDLLKSNVSPSVSGPPRRYYTITSEGRDTLKRWLKIWDQIKNNLYTILKGKYHD
ncbi:MAG: PadR family transcriptional regulator [Desulfobulbaceae bacterium]|nr:PadR family transcriptional regulator [Desulfobulbaceae bacterium]